MKLTPEITVAEAVQNILRGLRLSDDPRIAEVAARREVEEAARLQVLKTKALRVPRSGLAKAA